LKYPTGPLRLPVEAPRPVSDEYDASKSYELVLALESFRRARMRGGGRMTARPRSRPVAKPPMWEKLSRPGRRPRTKQITTWIRRIASCLFGLT